MGSGFYGVRFFSRSTSSFHPMEKQMLCTLITHSNLYPIFPSSSFSVDVFLSHSLLPLSPLTISAVFISILLPFNQLLILFFLPFFCSLLFFFGAKSFTNFYSLFIRVRTTTAKSCCCSRAACFAGVL